MGVDINSSPEKFYFYSLDQYSKIPSNSFSVNKYPPLFEFPTHIPQSNRKANGTIVDSIVNEKGLERFYDS